MDKKYINTLRRIMYLGLFLASSIVFFHWFANHMSLYWILRWLDIPMHILGGFIAALGVIWLAAALLFIRHNQKLSPKKEWLWGIVGVLIIGILWEFLEAAYGLSGLRGVQAVDTIADIINDILGGIIGILFWKRISK